MSAAVNKPKEKKGSTSMKNTANAFAGAADILGSGIDALFSNDGEAQGFEIVVSLDEIEIAAQVREEFEDEENSLPDLGKSLRKRQLQAIVLRPNKAGRDQPYLLVAGERRVRAARMEGLTELRARVEDLTDEEAEDAQLAENIHRKNLTQIEEAKKIQNDLDKLGSVDAVLEKHQKSRPWLSKMLSLLNLPEQSRRLVVENVTADVELINTVKTIEKTNPEAAKKLVEDLKATRGKANARDKAAAVKEQVKPSKKPKPAKSEKAGSEIVAIVKNRRLETPGPGKIFADAKSLAQVMNDTYFMIAEDGKAPQSVLDAMAPEVKSTVKLWLHAFYDAGKKSKDSGRSVIQGFRNGQFGSDGEGAFALVAFLQGSDQGTKFDMLNIMGCIKQ